MQGNNVYPIDIFSVASYGVEKWQKCFFWPLRHDWFPRLQKDTKNIFTTFINDNDNEIGDIALIEIKLFCELSNILYAVKMIQELDRQDKKINYSDRSVYFKAIIEKGVPEFSFIERQELQKPKLLTQILIALARLRDILLYRIYFFVSGDKIPLVVIKRSVAKREYFSRLHRKAIRVLNSGKVFQGKQKPLHGDLFKIIEKTTTRFMQEICALTDRYSIILSSKQREFMRSLIFRRFKKTAEDYISVKNVLSKNKRFHMFSGSHGSNFVRLLGQAVRRNGGKVTSFTHGYPLFECLRDLNSLIEWSTVDQYVARVNNCIDRIQKIIDKYPPPRNNKVKFVSENSTFFLDLYNKFRKTTAPPSNIKTVMLIATSYRVDFVRSSALPDLVYLDSEKRIIDFLVNHGYKVLYKKHPHGSLKGDIVKIFSEKAAVVYEPFERVMHMGDVFLFASGMGTTVWNQAICTQKPMIYINDGFHDIWFPEMLESVKKRCCVVSGGFDERNRLIFDEKELLGALAEKPKPADTEFLEKYMFPGKFNTGREGLDVD